MTLPRNGKKVRVNNRNAGMEAKFMTTARRISWRQIAVLCLTVCGCASPGGLADPFGLRSQDKAPPQPPESILYRSQGPGGFGGGSGGVPGGPPSNNPGTNSPGGYTGRPGASGVNRLRPRDDEELAPSPVDTAWKNVKNFFTGGPNEEKSREYYTEADELFRKKEYLDAAKLYAKSADKYPDSLIEEDAMFMQGECYFFADRYPKAEDAYGELFMKYDNTRHLDTVTKRLFKIAEYWDRLQTTDERYSLNPNLIDRTRPMFDTGGRAIKTLEAVWLADPTGPLADDAVMKLANMNFLQQDWEDADLYYTQIRQDFPNSQYLVPAYLLGFRTKLEKYDGAGYDRTPLDEAEVLIETLLAQFADQLGDDRDRVLQARDFVKDRKAEREWSMGEFYRRKGEVASAQMYYRTAVRDYANTTYGDQSRERLAELGDAAPTPTDRFAWLTNIFPERKAGPQPIANPTVLR